MKYIKTYENTIEDNSLQIGNYIIVDLTNPDDELELSEYLKNNAGQIIKNSLSMQSMQIKYTKKPNKSIQEKYFDIGRNNSWYIWIGKENNVIGFGKTTEEAYLMKNANKYNL